MQMIKLFISVLLSMFFISPAASQDQSKVLQIKYSPWGLIDADEDEFEYFDEPTYEKYDLKFDRSVGIKAIYEPFYVAVNNYITEVDAQVPNAGVTTFSLGLGGMTSEGFNPDIFGVNTPLYVMGGLGVGKGIFKFKNPDLNDYEWFIEGNAEVGLNLTKFLPIGIGVDYQLFGEPGESKAHYWNLYLSTGLRF
jgi:hypothetical protein